jgi:splicing factor 3B subunit 3
MHLYNLTLQRATGITHAVHGNFSGSKMQEILVSRGKSLELLRPDPNTGKVHTLLTVEVFGIVRSLMAFRLTGGTKGEAVIFNCSHLYYMYTQILLEMISFPIFLLNNWL